MSHAEDSDIEGTAESSNNDVASKKAKYDPFAEMQLWILLKRVAMHLQILRQMYSRQKIPTLQLYSSGVRYSNFSYHDIGAISITIGYISRYNLWFEITMKHYYEVNN